MGHWNGSIYVRDVCSHGKDPLNCGPCQGRLVELGELMRLPAPYGDSKSTSAYELMLRFDSVEEVEAALQERITFLAKKYNLKEDWVRQYFKDTPFDDVEKFLFVPMTDANAQHIAERLRRVPSISSVQIGDGTWAQDAKYLSAFDRQLDKPLLFRSNKEFEDWLSERPAAVTAADKEHRLEQEQRRLERKTQGPEFGEGVATAVMLLWPVAVVILLGLRLWVPAAILFIFVMWWINRLH